MEHNDRRRSETMDSKGLFEKLTQSSLSIKIATVAVVIVWNIATEGGLKRWIVKGSQENLLKAQ
jgi:hypothetical protein